MKQLDIDSLSFASLKISCPIDNLGLLKVGVPKTWDESKKDLGYVRKAGIRQFVSTYNRVKDLKGDELLWGDEIEYGIFHVDPETKKIRLSLRAKNVSNKCSITSSTKERQRKPFSPFSNLD